MNKTALITGVTGQDGAYLAELLLNKGYRVHGLRRSSSSPNTPGLDDLQKTVFGNRPDLKLHYGDITDSTNIARLIKQIEPDDYVITTGRSHSVRSFCKAAFDEVSIPVKWTGKGIDEKGIDTNSGRVIVEVDPDYFRPTEVDFLIGDATKAQKKLGWKPRVAFEELVKMMA
ncbi:MAG: GDP-mannose 4,6-dehydratase, partial [Actinomycetia bacterium]|nr:GDP-mannose 4,6-dehydratase [Actinomycetes bacterium]